MSEMHSSTISHLCFWSCGDKYGNTREVELYRKEDQIIILCSEGIGFGFVVDFASNDDAFSDFDIFLKKANSVSRFIDQYITMDRGRDVLLKIFNYITSKQPIPGWRY